MIGIIDCGDSGVEEIEKSLTDLKTKYRVIKMREIKEDSFKQLSGIIISGAPILLTQVDMEEYLSFFNFIKTVKIPVLGICFGHQVIGLLHGSKIHLGKMIEEKEKIEIVKAGDLFSGIKDHSLFQAAHSEAITLPEDFHLLARSKTCGNEAMQHKNRKLYGAQFHPEESGENGKILLKNFLKICS